MEDDGAKFRRILPFENNNCCELWGDKMGPPSIVEYWAQSNELLLA